MTDPAFKAMSVEEYLRTEEQSPVKREYVNGFVYVVNNSDNPRGQAGSSKAHAKIIFRIMQQLEPVAESLGCRAFSSEIRLSLKDHRSYYYPDVLVSSDANAPDEYTESAPCLLVEVLSQGTAHTDRHAKYAAYTAIPSLQTYLIVDQYERHVYAYQREAEHWLLTEYAGQDVIPLPCLNTQIGLDSIYDGVLPR